MIPDRAGYYGCQHPTTRPIYVVKTDSDLARQVVVVFTGRKERDWFYCLIWDFCREDGRSDYALATQIRKLRLKAIAVRQGNSGRRW